MQGGLSGAMVGGEGGGPKVHEGSLMRAPPTFPVGEGEGQGPSACGVPQQLAYLMSGWLGSGEVVGGRWWREHPPIWQSLWI